MHQILPSSLTYCSTSWKSGNQQDNINIRVERARGYTNLLIETVRTRNIEFPFLLCLHNLVCLLCIYSRAANQGPTPQVPWNSSFSSGFGDHLKAVDRPDSFSRIVSVYLGRDTSENWIHHLIVTIITIHRPPENGKVRITPIQVDSTTHTVRDYERPSGRMAPATTGRLNRIRPGRDFELDGVFLHLVGARSIYYSNPLSETKEQLACSWWWISEPGFGLT